LLAALTRRKNVEKGKEEKTKKKGKKKKKITYVQADKI